MISICTVFYPWWRKYDRTDEIFDVLIKSMNNCVDKDKLELSIVDGGVEDVWDDKRNRKHDPVKFLERICKHWHGNLKYSLDSEVIHRRPMNKRSFWVARAIDRSVQQSSSDRILTVGIDIELPQNFVEVYNNWVAPGKVLVFHCWHLRRDMPREHMKGMGNWRGTFGITGCMKEDYISIGGAEGTGKIKDRADSLRYLRLKDKFDLKHIKAEGTFHIDHPGCNEGTSEFKGTWK